MKRTRTAGSGLAIVGLITLAACGGDGWGPSPAGAESGHLPVEVKRAWVVRFASTAGAWETLLGSDLEVIGALPPDGYLVRAATAVADRAASSLPGLSGLTPYPPESKLSPALLAPPEGSLAGEPVVVDVVAFPATEPAATLASVGGLGPVLSQRFSFGRQVLRTRVDRHQLSALAALDDVEWVELAHPGRLFNDAVRVVMQTERNHMAANQGFYNPVYSLGVYGTGEVVTVADSGLRADHEQFVAPGKLLGNSLVAPGCGTLGDIASHGTAVVNTLLGDSMGPITGAYKTPNGLDGVALGAQVVMQDIVDESAFTFANPTTVLCDNFSVPTTLLKPAFSAGSMIHNDSWGHMYFDPVTDQGWGSYSLLTWELDSWLADPGHREQVVVFAAGNEGGEWVWVQQPAPAHWELRAVPRTVSDEGHAKNVITVGASRNASLRHQMYLFSSRGPTNDCGQATVQCSGPGRIKPDLVAPGSTTLHAASSQSPSSYCPDPLNCLSWDPDTSTHGYFGTSHAAPAVSGAAALVRDYFRQGFYPVRATDPPLTGPPSSALVKAMLVNSTVFLKDSSAYEASAMVGAPAAAYPNYDQGFGRPALDNVLEPAGYRSLMVFENNSTHVGSGEVWSVQPKLWDIWHSTCNVLRVTLAWTDPPPALAATSALVNDLDLEVTYANQVYLGNAGLNGAVPDRLNNVEDVFVPLGKKPGGAIAPSIRVRGTNLLVGEQPFAVVFTYGPCSDNTPCQQQPTGGGCYRGPGDVIPNPGGYTPGNSCEEQSYSDAECLDCGDAAYPRCSPPQVPGIIRPVPGALH